MASVVTAQEILDSNDRKTGTYHLVEIRDKGHAAPLCSHAHESLVEAIKCPEALSRVRLPV